MGRWNNNGNGNLQFVEVEEGVIEDQTAAVQEEENKPEQISNEEEDINDTGVQNEENEQH